MKSYYSSRSSHIYLKIGDAVWLHALQKKRKVPHLSSLDHGKAPPGYEVYKVNIGNDLGRVHNTANI